VGDELEAIVVGARQATVLNHSATHLLHAALRSVLGEHVQQKGSLVAPDRLRFDFSHYEPMTPAQLAEVEALVNAEIRANADAEIAEMAYDEAIKAGALAFFGEKYDARVRVLRLGDFSMELCGGTHVHRAGDIGLFKITSESGIAAGVRRIEAVTGAGALGHIERTEHALQRVAALVKGGREDLDVALRRFERLAAHKAQEEQDARCDQDARAGHVKGREPGALTDGDTDGEVGASPDDVDDKQVGETTNVHFRHLVETGNVRAATRGCPVPCGEKRRPLYCASASHATHSRHHLQRRA
jgi:alanyl-tRNA synthetase